MKKEKKNGVTSMNPIITWPFESEWVVYGPENGYNFPYPVF